MLNKKFIFSIFFISIFALTIVAINYNGDKTPNKFSASDPHSYRNNWNTASDSERITYLESSKDKKDSLDQLKKEIKNKIKLPKNTLNRKLLGSFLSKESNGIDKTVDLYYEKGLNIRIVPYQIPVDYDKWVEEDRKAEKNGSRKSDTGFNLISIKNNKGIASEPGFNVYENFKDPIPGYIAWCENGLEYQIYGYNLSTKELMKVAESMDF